MKNLLGYTLWIIAIVGMIALCTSCRSIKEVTKTETVVDSTALNEKSDSIRMQKNIIEFYEEMEKNREETGIVFDTVYRDTGRVVNKVVVRSDGTIEAEGRIKSLNITKDHQQRIISSQQETIDSLAVENERKEVALKVKDEHLNKKSETKVYIIPWYVWVLASLWVPFLLYYKYVRRKETGFPRFENPPAPPPKKGL